jgi:hypothetical protein
VEKFEVPNSPCSAENSHLAMQRRLALEAAGFKVDPRCVVSETEGRPATAQWAMFLRNHDELDLGRLF